MQINHLRVCDDFMTALTARQPSIGAVVEFRARTGRGLARD